MKRTFCIALALIAAPVAATPARSWIEYQYSQLGDVENTPGADSAIGHRLSFAYASSNTGYWRLDILRNTHEYDIDPLVVGDVYDGSLIDAGTEIDVGHWGSTAERELTTLTAGLRSPMNSEVDLIGEIGIARYTDTFETLRFEGVTGAPLTRISNLDTSATDNTWLLRLGLRSDAEALNWGATMEWYDKLPERTRWWNAYIGYRFTPNLNIALSYNDFDTYKGKGVTIAWQF